MKFKAGDKVTFTSELLHDKYPEYFPAVGTVGEVVDLKFFVAVGSHWVQWAKGSTSTNDLFLADCADLKLVKKEI